MGPPMHASQEGFVLALLGFALLLYVAVAPLLARERDGSLGAAALATVAGGALVMALVLDGGESFAGVLLIGGAALAIPVAAVAASLRLLERTGRIPGIPARIAVAAATLLASGAAWLLLLPRLLGAGGAYG